LGAILLSGEVETMRHTRVVVIPSVLLTTFCASSLLGSVVSDFDDGTMQGWTATGDLQNLSNPGSGGNPGGYLRLGDRAVGDICWVVAPSQFLGNWHGKTAVSVDLIQPSYSGDQIATVELVMSRPGGTYKRVFGERPPALWHVYGTALSEPLWTADAGANWDALLDNVTSFRIWMEFINGDEVTGLDNVSLTGDCPAVTIGAAKQMPDGARGSLGNPGCHFAKHDPLAVPPHKPVDFP